MSMKSRINRLEKISGMDSDVDDYPLVVVLIETRDQAEYARSEHWNQLARIPDPMPERGYLTFEEALHYQNESEDLT